MTALALLGLSGAAQTAYAAHQPLALGSQTISLEAGKTETAFGYCLDLALRAPHEDTEVPHVIDGKVQACYGGRCVDLETAIADKVVRVTGAPGYRLRFENLKDFRVDINIVDAVMSDVKTKIAPPKVKFPTASHDNATQYDTWRALGQIDAFDRVTVHQFNGNFVVEGVDAHGRTAQFATIPEGDLGATLSHFAMTRDAALEINAQLPMRTVEALVQDIRVHTAAKGLHALVDVTADELLEHAKISKVSASTPDAATIVANCEMKTPMDTYAAKVTVTLHTPADLTLRQRIAARASDAIRSIARGKTKTLLSTATDVRDAVKAEVKALRASTDWSRDAIWLLLSDSAGGQVLVFIPLSEVQWQG